MKYFIYVINCLLVILIPIAFIVTPVEEEKSNILTTKAIVKQLKSGILNSTTLIDDNVVLEDTEDNEEIKEVEEVESDKDVSSLIVSNTEESTNQTTEDSYVPEETVEEEKKVTDVLETQVGKMSGYGPDCVGCSGYLASGKYVGDGTTTYHDTTYGDVRIVAGDRSYPFGTIVRINNSKVGSFLAIVLDRGGSIGIGKKFLFDLLYSSEAEASYDGVSYQVTFEILRYGY